MTTEPAEDIPDLASLSAPTNSMAQILHRYSTDRRSLERKYPVPYSMVRRNRLRSFLAGWLAAIELLDFESMSRAERIDYTLFSNHLNYCRKTLDKQEEEFQEMEPLIPFARRILLLEEARRRMDWADPQAAAEELHGILATVKSANDAVKACECSSGGSANRIWKRSVANRAAHAIESLSNTLRDWFTFYNGYCPLFTWWAESPYREVSEALEAYRTHIARTMINADADGTSDIIGDPIGSAALDAELRYEMVSYSPDELIEIANRELAWCEAEMLTAANELGCGCDIRAAMEHVKRLHVPPGGQPDLVKSLALEAVEYLDERDILTVPPLARETWRLEMMSPEKQRVNPFFLGGEVIQVSFPTNTMTHEQKQMSMRGNNSHFARATVQHELIPGHHLQWFMQERYNTHRRPFHTPFWVEGWTIYWEFLLYQMGFPTCAEDRIGMLFWRMHRCVRVIFSLSFHLEKMTPQECIEMLVERVGHERANAEAEVRRSCGDAYPPLYQCAYLIGGLQMWALRKELVDTGKMAEREFHDAVIQENCIPIEMIRADLKGVELPKDFVSDWRFYGEV
jgi:uncharacterized protein (DUF885 family)